MIGRAIQAMGNNPSGRSVADTTPGPGSAGSGWRRSGRKRRHPIPHSFPLCPRIIPARPKTFRTAGFFSPLPRQEPTERKTERHDSLTQIWHIRYTSHVSCFFPSSFQKRRREAPKPKNKTRMSSKFFKRARKCDQPGKVQFIEN